jgi:hypothetical protein
MNQTTLENIVDFYESYDSLLPCPTYAALQADWFEDAADALGEIDSEERADPSHIQFVESVMTKFLESASSSWNARTVDERRAHIETLVALPQTGQRTAAWYSQSKEVLTASEFSQILGTPRALETLALQKVASTGVLKGPPRLACATSELGPMDWGVRFEPVVKQILHTMWGADIVDVGRLYHPTDAYLAASPDGLIRAATDETKIGRLLEIKCPIKRELTGKIPFEYWCQMQLQMEVTGIDECEYLEVKLVSATRDRPEYVAATAGLGLQYNGTVWLLQDAATLELSYAYTEVERAAAGEKGLVELETIPWHLDSFFSSVVARDRAWFASTAGKRERFWEMVGKAKQGTLEVAPYKKGVTVQVCKIED